MVGVQKSRRPELVTLLTRHKGKVTDKWSLYLDVYDRIFRPFRSKSIRLLEIGIQNGGSLEIWRKYFPKARVIIGCDVNFDCSSLRFDDDRIKLVIGNATSDDTRNSILSLSAEFDIIIDDGSHKSSDVVKSFAHFFNHVSAGGLYIVEDLHCSYWKDFEGGFNSPYSSMSFFKRLTDVLNQEHWGVNHRRADALDGFAKKYSIAFDEASLASIHSIQFLNSFCSIKKLPPEENALGRRKVAGRRAIINKDILALNNTTSQPADQAENPWSLTPVSLEDEIATWPVKVQQYQHALSEASSRLAKSETKLESLNNQIAQFLYEKEEISRALRTAQEMARTGQDEVERLTGELTRLKGELASRGERYEIERDRLLSVETERNNYIVTLTRELSAAQSFLRDSQNQTQRLAGELAAVQDELAREAQEHAAERARLIAAGEARDGRIATLTQELAAAQQELQQCSAQLQAREAQLDALAATSKEQLMALTAERDAIRNEADRAATERDAAARQVAQLSADLSELQTLVQQRETERDTQAARAQRAEDEAARVAGELAAAQDELARRMKDYDTERDAAARQVAQLSADLSELQTLVQQRETERDTQAARAQRAEDEAAQLRTDRDQGRATLAQREQELAAQARDARIAKAQSEQLRATILQQAEALAALAPKPGRSPAAALRALRQRFSRWQRTDYRRQAWEAETIRASGLFSALGYLTRYPDVAAAGTDPLLHYLRHGAAEGRSPHLLFDAGFYLKQHPEAAEAKMSALAHYASAGVAAGFDPHPLFDTDWYLQQNPDVAAAGVNPLQHYITQGWREGRDPHPLFDTSFYLEQNPDVAAAGENPLVHYCVFGWKEGRDPHPDFDTSFYLEQNRDVAEAGIEPLTHYVAFGKQEGRKASTRAIRKPTVRQSSIAETVAIIQQSDLFDAEWYVSQRLGLVVDNISPIEHYISHGVSEGLNPNPIFNTNWYLASYPDVARSKMNPLVHYIIHGSKERCDPHPLFDSDWYLSKNVDVKRANANPLRHYLKFGAKERRDPHFEFDSSWYCSQHFDIGETTRNPLVDYITYGAKHNYSPNPTFARSNYSDGTVAFDSFGIGEYGPITNILSYHPVESTPQLSNETICVQLHLFYVELADHFAELLNRLKCKHTLLVSLREGADSSFWRQFFLERVQHAQDVIVRNVPNRGRDVLPWVVTFAKEIQDHSILFHLHSKKSSHNSRQQHWRRFLEHTTFGSQSIVNQILTLFTENPRLGLVYPPYMGTLRATGPIFGWGQNRELFQTVYNKLTKRPAPRGCPDFPAGSFFWARTKALKPLLELGLTVADFPPEAGQVDGTLAHAIERIVGALPELTDMETRCVAIDVPYHRVSTIDPPALPVAAELRCYSRFQLSDENPPIYIRGTLQIEATRPTALLCAHASGKHVFGGERSLIDLLDGFRTIGINVFCSIPRLDNAEYIEAIRTRSAGIYAVPYEQWHHSRPNQNHAIVRQVEDIIRTNKIDLVYANTIMLREPLAAAKQCGIRSIIHAREIVTHDEELAETIGLTPQEIVDSVIERADHIVANSEATAACYKQAKSLSIVPNATDTVELDVPNIVDTSTIRFGLVSSNSPKKGLLDLVALASRCTNLNAQFVVIGPNNSYVDQLIVDQIKGTVPQNIKFIGPRSSPSEAMAETNVILNLSSFAESFGRTVAEAMATRRPVIAYDWGALSELVRDGETGFLVPYRDISALADKVSLLCMKPTLIHELGNRGREFVARRYSPERLAKTLRITVSSLLTKQSSPKCDITLLRSSPRTAIVVPIYNALECVRTCLSSVKYHTNLEENRLIVIDDASTDERINEYLTKFCGPNIQHIRNINNLGYTKTCNIGIRAAGIDDVVLLNSDTVVTPRWLESLRIAAYSMDNIGTATALSDNAGAFSVPKANQNNPRPQGVGHADYARLIRQFLGGLEPPDVPTGNGFCLLIKRKLIDDIGYLDEEAFPRGYGEENDFCMRALLAGWRNVIAPGAFVFHSRTASFEQMEKESLVKAGLELLVKRYPDYMRRVRNSFSGPAIENLRMCASRAHRAAITTRAETRVVTFTITLPPKIESTAGMRRFFVSPKDAKLLLPTAKVGATSDGDYVTASTVNAFGDWLLTNAIEFVEIEAPVAGSNDFMEVCELFGIPSIKATDLPRIAKQDETTCTERVIG